VTDRLIRMATALAVATVAAVAAVISYRHATVVDPPVNSACGTVRLAGSPPWRHCRW
jgi:hypothetical protein